MSRTIQEYDVVKLKSGIIGTILYIHDPKIKPQGYELQEEKTDKLITVTENDIQDIIYKHNVV